MSTQTTTANSAYEQAMAAKADAARALYNAELALHDAHQSHVDSWITAAQDRLHLAVTRYFAADTLLSRLREQPMAA